MPPLTLASARQVIHDLRSRLLSKPSSEDCQILGMSLGKIEQIAAGVDRAKGETILGKLTQEYYREETAKEKQAKSLMSTKPQATPAKPVAITQPTARPVAIAPPPRPIPTATADLARAILDETDRRNAAALIKPLAEFKKLSPREASAFCRAGGKITA